MTSYPGAKAVLVGLTVLATSTLATPAGASATSQEVVYAADVNSDGVYSIEIRDLNSRQTRAVLPADTTNGWSYADPELSPSGDRVALASDRGSAADGGEGIAVVNRDGTGFRRLTNPTVDETVEEHDIRPAWAPDGQRLLFTRVSVGLTDGTVRSALYTVDLAGSITPVSAPNGFTADWDPTGARIVYAALTDPSRATGVLHIVPTAGGTPTSLGVEGALPAWSPDGETIVYAKITERDPDATRANDVAVLATVPAAGGSEQVLTATRPSTAKTVAEYPAWAPDGQSIVYDLYGYDSSGTPTQGDLWAVDRSGTRAGKIVASAGDELGAFVHGPAPQRVSSTGPASRYVPLAPQRILDTRNGTGRAGTTRVGPGGTVTLPVRGLTARTSGGEPVTVPADASAVVLNVTVTAPTAGTDVRVYPSGAALPLVSNLNAGRGDTVPNLVTSAIGSDGAVVLRNSGGEVHLIADLAGYYGPAASGAGFTSLDPQRLLDTRNGTGAPVAKVGAGGVLDLQVTGTRPTAGGGQVTVPADASAVVLNVTGTAPTAATDIRVYPTTAAGTLPLVSNLNLRAGQTAANLVTVAVGEGGKVRLRNSGGSVHLIADIAGYYTPQGGSQFVPVVPQRFLDTRNGTGAAAVGLTAGGALDLRVGGFRGVPSASAAVLNLTATGVTSTTHIQAYPSGAVAPTVSNLNLSAGQTRANLSVVKLSGGGQVRLRNAAGSTQLIADLAGYFL